MANDPATGRVNSAENDAPAPDGQASQNEVATGPSTDSSLLSGVGGADNIVPLPGTSSRTSEPEKPTESKGILAGASRVLSRIGGRPADECLSQPQLQDLWTRALTINGSDNVKEELSSALGLAHRIRSRNIYVEGAQERLNFIFDCLSRDPPEMILGSDERLRLKKDLYRRAGLISRVLAWISSGSSVTLVLSALVASTFCWAGVVVCIYMLSRLAPNNAADGQPISVIAGLASSIFFMNGHALSVVASAALIGGLISIASRLREFSRVRDLDPAAMFWTATLKPLVGVILAIFLFATLAGGLINFGFFATDAFNFPGAGEAKPAGAEKIKLEKTFYILWVLGFLAGFSERFAWDFVERAQSVATGGLGGPQK